MSRPAQRVIDRVAKCSGRSGRQHISDRERRSRAYALDWSQIKMPCNLAQFPGHCGQVLVTQTTEDDQRTFISETFTPGSDQTSGGGGVVSTVQNESIIHFLETSGPRDIFEACSQRVRSDVKFRYLYRCYGYRGIDSLMGPLQSDGKVLDRPAGVDKARTAIVRRCFNYGTHCRL